MPDVVNIEKKYRIGEMDQRVQILAPTEAQNTGGEVTQTWGEYATRWASVTPIGGQESVISDMIQPVSRARFVLRYDATITEKYRLVWNSHTYNIVSIDVVPRNRFLIIIAESFTLSGSVAVDYGNYYSTNSLKIRVVTGVIDSGSTPTIEEIETAVGLTAAQAGNGYCVFIIFTDAVDDPYPYLVITNGTTWYYSKNPYAAAE